MEITKNMAGGVTMGLSAVAIAGGVTLIAVSVLYTASNVVVVAAIVFTALAVGVGIVSITAWNKTATEETAQVYFQNFGNQMGIGVEAVAIFVAKAIVGAVITGVVREVMSRSTRASA